MDVALFAERRSHISVRHAATSGSTRLPLVDHLGALTARTPSNERVWWRLVFERPRNGERVTLWVDKHRLAHTQTRGVDPFAKTGRCAVWERECCLGP